MGSGSIPVQDRPSVFSQTSRLYHSKLGAEEEGIAIIGYSFRFPQEATNSEALWNVLLERRCTVTDFPKDRMNASAFYHPDNSRTDCISVKGAHLLKGDLGEFDASFFSFAAHEVECMDPQQRALLEVTYRAFENAGITQEAVYGTKTSVHTGCFSDDYKLGLIKDPQTLPKHSVAGASMAIIANRLSWFYGLTGPSCNVDTACSSSLIALDLACQGLRNNSANMAVVAGSNLVFAPEGTLLLGNMQFLSPDGCCYSFDHRANGYARGEGFGVLILKPISEAIAAGDTIRAVIRSTGANQDGHTQGITNPSQEAQETLIRDTYAKAGLDMGLTRYFEAHGTGTLIGDLVESNAVGNCFRDFRDAETPLFVGSIKSNVGHLEGCSGVAGIIKTIMILERGIIPALANFESLNPTIDANHLKLEFPTSAVPWPGDGLRRASVNSFGFGGANAHAVLDDAYHYLASRGLKANHSTATAPSLPSRKLNPPTLSFPPVAQDLAAAVSCKTPTLRLITLSSADSEGIKRLAQSYQSHFAALDAAEVDNNYMESLAYTLSQRRTQLTWRATALVRSIEDLRNIPELLSRPSRAHDDHGLAFVFTGQGAQFCRMGQGLLHYRVFKTVLAEASSALCQFGCKWWLLDEILKDESTSKINEPEYSQPLCTALQIALLELLRSFGVQARAVTGHSSGEIAAAYAAGGLSLSSACKVAYFRGKLASTLVHSDIYQGGMMAVGLSASRVQPYLDEVSKDATDDNELLSAQDKLVIACFNSPQSVTLSGPSQHIDKVKSLLDRDGVFVRKLPVNVAYHSPQMEKISTEYHKALEPLEAGQPLFEALKMVSSVTGEVINASTTCDPEYWVRNLISPVQFVTAAKKLLTQSSKSLTKKLDGSHRRAIVVYDLVELGPHSALQGPLKEIIATLPRKSDITYNSALKRKSPAHETLLDLVGLLYRYGYPISFTALNQTQSIDKSPAVPRVLTGLPEYPFDHSKSYWHESRFSTDYRQRPYPNNDLLGVRTADWNPAEARWRKITTVNESPWIADHKINGAMIYPAAGILVMVIEAARQMVDPKRHVTGYRVGEAVFTAPFRVSAERGVETELHFRSMNEDPDINADWFSYRLYIRHNEEWIENSRGTIGIDYDSTDPAFIGRKESEERLRMHQAAYNQIAQSCDRTVDKEAMYRCLDELGINLGPTFHSMENIAANDKFEAVADIRMWQWSEHEMATQAPVIHPTRADAMFQTMATALTKGAKQLIDTTIPTRISNLWLSSKLEQFPRPEIVKVAARSHYTGFRTTSTWIFALDSEKSQLLITVDDLETTTVSAKSQQKGTQKTLQRCYELHWRPDIALCRPEDIQALCSADGRSLQSHTKDNLTLNSNIIDLTRKATKDIKEMQSPVPGDLQSFVTWMSSYVETFQFSDTAQLTSCPQTNADGNSSESSCDGKEARLIRLAKSLTPILSGMQAAEPLILGSASSSSTAYQQQRPELVRYLDMILHKRSNLRILHVDDNSYGPDSDILSLMRSAMATDDQANPVFKYAHYTYAHSSCEVIDSLRKELSDLEDHVATGVLDLKADHLTQGFQQQSFDVVLVHGSIAAAHKPENVLKSLYPLMRDKGKLVILDTGYDQLAMELCLRLLPRYRLNRSDSATTAILPHSLISEWESASQNSEHWGESLFIHDNHSLLSQSLGCSIFTIADPPSRNNLTETNLTIVDQNGALAESLLEFAGRDDRLHIQRLNWDQAIRAKDLSKGVFVIVDQGNDSILSNMDAYCLNLIQRITAIASSILWVYDDDYSSQQGQSAQMITGLARTVRSERPTLRFVTLELEQDQAISHKTNQLCKVLEQYVLNPSDHYETELKEVAGLLNVNRFVDALSSTSDLADRMQTSQTRTLSFSTDTPLALRISDLGMLDTLHYAEDEARDHGLQPLEVEIEVRATGVNFMDVLTALGRIKQTEIGVECAGVISRVGSACTRFAVGDAVCAAVLDCFKTFTKADERLCIKIPSGLSFAKAAGMPLAFVTSHYGLIELARLRKGESVLIHAAAGSTGQAAVQIAQHVGAEIYATVGSAKKAALLTEIYGIPETHIFYSRDLSFAQGIKRMTTKGVDVVLNSLAGKKLVASWECIAPYGRFVEIGKRDIHARNHLPMFPFAKNVAFFGLDIAGMIRERPDLIQQSLSAVMESNLFHTPEPMTGYPVSQTEEAFRHLQSGSNMGKTIVEFKRDDPVMATILNRPQLHLDPAATYVIAGGLGGLGRSTARWLIERGARNLLLLSRSGLQTAASVDFVEQLRDAGARIEAPACDICCAEALEEVLKNVDLSMPPIKGCIQGTMVLRDSLFENMTIEQWNLAVRSKVQGSWNLHAQLPSNMDFFLFLSSISGVIGNIGQANYAAGNTYMDALCHWRRARGLKAVSLNLGWMAGEGVVAEQKDLQTKFAASGFLKPISQEEYFHLLEKVCDPCFEPLHEAQSQLTIGLELPHDVIAKGNEVPFFMHRQMFQHMWYMGPKATPNSESDTKTNHVDMFSKATSLAGGAYIILDALIERLSKALSIPSEDLDSKKPLHSYGVDSLMSVELRSWLAQEWGAEVAIFDIMGAPNMTTLSVNIARNSKHQNKEWDKNEDQ